MISINRVFEWDMGHRVTNHDSLCKNPHGHRYKMEITLSGPVNSQHGNAQQGMVMDFGKLKDIVNSNIIAKLDHSFMFWGKDRIMKNFALQNAQLKLVEVPFVPTAECIAQYIADSLQEVIHPDYKQFRLEKLTVYETPNCKAEWQREA